MAVEIQRSTTRGHTNDKEYFSKQPKKTKNMAPIVKMKAPISLNKDGTGQEGLVHEEGEKEKEDDNDGP
jgi:hypothetical protein